MSEQPDVTLRPVGADNWYDVTELKLAAGQEDFIAPNWYSIIQALFDDDEMRAIYADETLVGFAMWTLDYDEREAFIARLMVDKDHQRKGYGRAAMEILLDDLRDNRDIDEVFISFVPENAGARELYSSLGFEDTGEVDEGELVYKLNVM